MSEIIAIEDPEEWDDLLAGFQDASIYQSFGYGVGRAQEAPSVRLVLNEGGARLGLAQLRVKTIPGFRAGLAHCYFGPVVRTSQDADPQEVLDRYQAALRVLLEGWVQPRGLVLRLVSHLPEDLYPGVTRVLEEMGFCPLEQRPYRTILVDLKPGLEEIKKSFRPRFRTKINKATKLGVRIEVGGDLEAFRRFQVLYDEMYARKGFHTKVRVETFARAQSFLRGKDRMMVFLATYEGKDLGGLVLSAMGDTGIYLLGATRILEELPNHNASNLLHWRAIEECKNRGLSVYDLCGVDPEKDPGGYRFKTGFRGRELTYPGSFDWGGSLLSKAAVRAGEFLHRIRGKEA
ncbi:MAG TPA: peptidoglycan bridge formation glycyltransferase FemA/FemB family protein [Planctomycetes bacterium]|nr:peptidoglycan bridge formation glycyltransferase FemA/FemB family protein [Planctomycetota bacterium]